MFCIVETLISDQIAYFMIDGSRISQYSSMRNLIHGSNRQDFDGETVIILLTAFLET